MARLARLPSAGQFLLAGLAATLVGVLASMGIARRGSAEEPDEPEQPEQPEESGGQVSEVSGMQDGPQVIYPDQAVSGYPESESGMPDEGPAGPNSKPDWDGPGTGS